MVVDLSDGDGIESMSMNALIDTENADLVALRDLGYEHAERSAALMSCSPDCIKLLTPDGRIGYMSHNGRCAMDIDDLALVHNKYWWSLWPEDRQDMIRDAVTTAATGKTVNFIADCPTGHGRPARWDVTVQGIFGGDGQLIEIMAVSRATADMQRQMTCF